MSTAPDRFLQWWQKALAQQRLTQWLVQAIGDRPYTIRYALGGGSFIDFSTREIVIDPHHPHERSAAARMIPTTWAGQPIARLSTLEVMCARALTWHEAAHALFTEPGPVLGPLHATLVNMLEDERIEQLMMRSFPPAARDLPELRLRCWLTPCPAYGDRLTLLLNACLYHRWDHTRPAGEASRLVIPPDDALLWTDTIRPLVEQSWSVATTAEVTTIARQILDLLGVRPTARVPRGVLGASPDALPAGERAEDDVPDDALAVLTADTPPVPTPDDLDIHDEALTTGRLDHDLTDGSLWAQPYQTLQAEVIGQVRKLAQALQLPTPDTDPRPDARRGRFQSRAYVRSQGRTPLLRPADVAPAPDGLALVVLLDGTSSMRGHPSFVRDDGGPGNPGAFHAGRMPHVRRAAMLLERACATSGIPLCLGVARNNATPPHLGRTIWLERPVVWIKDWTSPPHAEGPRAFIAGLAGDAMCEAVSASLDLAVAKLTTRPEGHRVILYIHDGNPEDETSAEVRASVDRVRRQGITVIGVFVGDQAALPLLQAIFAPRWTIGVPHLTELPKRLGRLLTQLRTA